MYFSYVHVSMVSRIYFVYNSDGDSHTSAVRF